MAAHCALIHFAFLINSNINQIEQMLTLFYEQRSPLHVFLFGAAQRLEPHFNEGIEAII